MLLAYNMTPHYWCTNPLCSLTNLACDPVDLQM